MIVITTTSLSAREQINNLEPDGDRYIRWGQGKCKIQNKKVRGWWLCYPSGDERYLGPNACKAMLWIREHERMEYRLKPHGGKRENAGPKAVLTDPIRRLYTLEARHLQWIENESKRRKTSASGVLRAMIDREISSP